MKLEEKVMGKIQNKEVKMKSKWWFVAKNGGERGIWGLMMLAGAVFFAGIIYSIEILGPGELLSMGSVGREVLADSLPYKLIGTTLVILGISGLVYAKLGDNYKKTVGGVILKLAAILAIAATILTLARMAIERGWLFI